MKANTNKSVATTKSAKTNKGVKPLVMVSDVKSIKEEFGKYSIIIKGNAVYRCSTDTLERGPKALYDLYLPNYGKMRKFVVKEDGVYEIRCLEEHPFENSNLAQYTITEKVNINPSKISFDLKEAWNNKKVTE
jgi:hypothetical protein